MKKLLCLALSFAFVMPSFAQKEEVTKVIEGVENLEITTRNNTTTIIAKKGGEAPDFIYQVVTGTESMPAAWNFECPFSFDYNDGSNNCCNNFTPLKDIYWGWNFNYDEKNGIKNCFEVGVGEVLGLTFSPFKNGPSFNVGLGFGMRRYLVQKGLRFNRIENDLIIEPVAPGMDVDRSRVDSWSFHVPVMITQNIYKKLAISVGAWINFNTYVKGWTQYYADGIKYKEYYKGFNQRFCTVDLVGVIGLRNGIGFYGRWSPISLFKDGRGPEFKSASMGVMLNF